MSRILPIFRRSLTDSWRSTLGWSIGLAAALALYLPLFPSIGGNGQMQQLIDGLPPELVKTLGYEQISSGAGYTQATFYGLIGFALLTIAATSWGSSAIAGAEESGRLELALAHAVGRVQYALETALSIFVRLLWLAVFSAAIVLALDGPADLGLRPGNVVAESAAFAGLAMLTATFALAVGALTGRRVFATAAGAGIAVIGYVFNAVANQVTDAEGLQSVSPYAWAYSQTPLMLGADGGGLALLWGLSAALAVLAAVALSRRDITG